MRRRPNAHQTSQRTALFALCALGTGTAAACFSPRPLPPTAEESAAAIALALRSGNIEHADVLRRGARQRHPDHPEVLAWSAVVASLQWEDDLAVAELRQLLGRAEPNSPAAQSVAGLLGDALFQAGRYGESLVPLWDGAGDGPDAERRRACAALARELPFRRKQTGPLATERPLAADGVPEFECAVGDTRRPFTIDTGSSATTLSRSLALELAVRQLQPAGNAVDGTGRSLAIEVGILDGFAVGDVDLGAVPVVVVADGRLSMRDILGGPDRAPAAVLGLDVLALFRLTLDPARRSVSLELPRGLPAAASVQTVRADGRCLMPVTVEGARLWFVLDTGASHSSITAAGLAALPGGESRAVPGFRRVRTTAGNDVAVREVRDLVLRASEVRFRGVVLPVVLRREGAVFPVHGVLGADLLHTCRLTLDRGRVRLESVTNEEPR
jgi:predicted aspartyl protease